MLKKSFIIPAAALLMVGLFIVFNKKPDDKQLANYKPPFIQRPYGSDLPKEPAALPNEWMGYQRTFPYGKIKQDNYLIAIRNAQELHSLSLIHI